LGFRRPEIVTSDRAYRDFHDPISHDFISHDLRLPPHAVFPLCATFHLR
jgi:hypothetical protein